MSNETLTEKLTKTPEGIRLYQQERAIQEWTEEVCKLMQEKGISHSELAQRLNKSKGYVTLLLDGRAKMDIRIMSDVFTALRASLHFASYFDETDVEIFSKGT